MNKIIFYAISICLSFLIDTSYGQKKPETQFPETKFHLATTEAEKKLDYILNFTGSEDNPNSVLWRKLHSYIEKWPHIHPKMKLQYTDILTKDFIYAWSLKEKKEVDDDCGGRYIKGDLCGLGFIVLTCAQDSFNTYLYRTLEETDDYVIIQYAWPDFIDYNTMDPNTDRVTMAHATYKLVKRNNIWLLDATKCEHMSRFHINFYK